MNSFLKTTCTFFLVSAGLAGLLLIANDGFGASDLKPFLVWTFIFGVVVGFVKERLQKGLLRLQPLLRYGVALAAGLLFGILGTYLLRVYLGAWFGTFSLNVLPCWVAGGTSGMLVNLSPDNNSRRALLFELPAIMLIALSVLTLGQPLSSLIGKNRSLEVISLRWLPGPQPLIVRGRDAEQLFRDSRLLRDIGLSGELTFSGSSRHGGGGKTARAVIIMYQQLNEPVDLPQPDASEIIYVQKEGGWSRYPADAPVLDRTIRLWVDSGDPNRVTRYSVELFDGSRQGGTLFTW